jgi:hypothetical protein
MMGAGDAPKITEGDVLDALRQKYAPPAFAFLSHVATGTGAHAARTIDGLAMSVWPSRGYEIFGFEVKVSRSDWLRELKQPAKADAACRCVDKWYIVAPESVVMAGELPKGWGYLAYLPGASRVLRTVRDADELPDPHAMHRAFVAALFRKIDNSNIDVRTLTREREQAYANGLEAGKKLGAPHAGRIVAEHDRLRQRVDAFERASGINIDGYTGADTLGEAVKAIVAVGAGVTRQTLSYQRRAIGRLLEQYDQAIGLLQQQEGQTDAGHETDRESAGARI